MFESFYWHFQILFDIGFGVICRMQKTINDFIKMRKNGWKHKCITFGTVLKLLDYKNQYRSTDPDPCLRDTLGLAAQQISLIRWF